LIEYQKFPFYVRINLNTFCFNQHKNLYQVFHQKSEKKFREIMADTGVDIDLYADMESEFPTDFASGDSKELNKSDSILDDPNVAGGSGTEPTGTGPDLYDDVLTNIKDDQKPNPGDNRGQGLEKSQSSSSLNSSSHDRDNRGGSAPPRRYQVVNIYFLPSKLYGSPKARFLAKNQL
jgi:hypothetical protein